MVCCKTFANNRRQPLVFVALLRCKDPNALSPIDASQPAPVGFERCARCLTAARMDHTRCLSGNPVVVALTFSRTARPAEPSIVL